MLRPYLVRPPSLRAARRLRPAVLAGPRRKPRRGGRTGRRTPRAGRAGRAPPPDRPYPPEPGEPARHPLPLSHKGRHRCRGQRELRAPFLLESPLKVGEERFAPRSAPRGRAGQGGTPEAPRAESTPTRRGRRTPAR